jgi:hypothetical protein
MVTATVVRRYNAKQDKYVLVLFDDWAGWAQNRITTTCLRFLLVSTLRILRRLRRPILTGA